MSLESITDPYFLSKLDIWRKTRAGDELTEILSEWLERVGYSTAS